MNRKRFIDSVSLSIIFLLFCFSLLSVNKPFAIFPVGFFWGLGGLSFLLFVFFTFSLFRPSVLDKYEKWFVLPPTSQFCRICWTIFLGILWMATLVGLVSGAIPIIGLLPSFLRYPAIILIFLWSIAVIIALFVNIGRNKIHWRLKQETAQSKDDKIETKVEHKATQRRITSVEGESILKHIIVPSLIIWLLSVGLSVALVAVLPCIISTQDYAGLNFTIEKLALIANGVLGFIGALTAILIAVLTWTYTQSRSNRDSGFGKVREAVNQLQILAEKMRDNAKRASPSYQPMLVEWADATDQIVERLNNITMVWQGFGSDQSLENELSNYALLPNLLDDNMARFLVYDAEWSSILIDNDHQVRSILAGLLSMERGVIDYQLFNRILRVFYSLVVLVGIVLIVRFLADVPLSSIAAEFINACLGAIITLLTIAHVFWLAWSVFKWWREMLRRDKMWAS